MRRVKIIIYGRVQGVGFRYFIKNLADKCKVKGFVRNLPNGSIEIDAEADRNTISDFIEHCKVGTKLSRIDDLIVQNIQFWGFTTFQIRH